MTSRTFGLCFDILLGHEGGYVNDSRDPGGETKYGICKRSYPNEDIKGLTPARAMELYRRDYWDRIRGDELPPGLALLVFDCAVHCGVGRAVDLLQKACGVIQDGQLGPRTIAAASCFGVDAKFHLERALFLTELKTWPSFSKGWAVRLATLPFQAAVMDE